MMNLRNKFFHALLISLLSACYGGSCELIDLDDEDLVFFNTYHLGDSLIMRSNLNRYDTLVVVKLEKNYTPCNRFELGKFQFQYAELTLESSLIPTSLYPNIQLSISKESPVNPSMISIYGFDLEYNTNVKLPRKKLEENIILSAQNDSIHSLKFTKSNSNSYGEHVIRSFNWSEKLGLVRYTIESGEVFDLIEKF